MRPLCAVVLFALASGCLRPPPLPPPSDAGAPRDAGPPPELALEGLSVRDRTGADWPLDAMPRQPVVVLRWTTAPAIDPDEPPPVHLVSGDADGALLDDLAEAPLRAEHRARILPATLVAGARTWELRADARLAPGAHVVAIVGAWLRSAADETPIPEAIAIPLVVSTAPTAGATVTDSWPPAGAMTVSPALDELALRLDGPLGPRVEGAIALLEGARPEDARVDEVACPEVGWPDGWCVRVVPARALRRESEHRLVVDARQLDATGAPIGPFEAIFRTAADDEAPPPAPRPPAACAPDERATELGCVLEDDARVVLRLDAGEPVRWRWTLGGRSALGVAPRGAITIASAGLAPETTLEAVLELEGTARVTSRFLLPVGTTEPLATVAIVEVRADPSGPEPAQEYVELVNYGRAPVSLDGFALTDRADAVGDLLAGALAPSERALVVAASFDPDDPSDAPIPPGVRLLRVEGPLGSGGLSNAGEPLFLRDALGRRVSAAPALATRAGTCIVRGGPSMRDEADFREAPCTPGAP